MFKHFYSVAAVSAAAILSLVAPCYADAQVTLKAGTPVVLATTGMVSTKSVIPGSTVDFMVVSDVMADGQVAIAAGTIAKGQIGYFSKPSPFGQGGEFSLQVNAVNAVNGALVPLSGANVSASGEDRTGLSIVCGLFTLVGFLIPGEPAELPAGTQVNAVVMTNVDVTASSK